MPFDSVIQPGPKKFDFDINEVSITDERKKAVDFSSGYYDVAQAIITTKGSKIANAKSVADLKTAKIGAQVGHDEPGHDPRRHQAQRRPGGLQQQRRRRQGAQQRPDRRPRHRPADRLLHHGLRRGEEQQRSSGSSPNQGGTPEQFGLVLDKGSALTSCVTQAVDALRQDGTLKKLEQQWLAQSAGAPVLQ